MIASRRSRYYVRNNAVHSRPSRRISREVRAHNLRIEFEFELDFSRVAPCRAKCELVLRSDKRARLFFLNDFDPLGC